MNSDEEIVELTEAQMDFINKTRRYALENIGHFKVRKASGSNPLAERAHSPHLH